MIRFLLLSQKRSRTQLISSDEYTLFGRVCRSLEKATKLVLSRKYHSSSSSCTLMGRMAWLCCRLQTPRSSLLAFLMCYSSSSFVVAACELIKVNIFKSFGHLVNMNLRVFAVSMKHVLSVLITSGEMVSTSVLKLR